MSAWAVEAERMRASETELAVVRRRPPQGILARWSTSDPVSPVGRRPRDAPPVGPISSAAGGPACCEARSPAARRRLGARRGTERAFPGSLRGNRRARAAIGRGRGSRWRRARGAGARAEAGGAPRPSSLHRQVRWKCFLRVRRRTRAHVGSRAPAARTRPGRTTVPGAARRPGRHARRRSDRRSRATRHSPSLTIGADA